MRDFLTRWIKGWAASCAVASLVVAVIAAAGWLFRWIAECFGDGTAFIVGVVLMLGIASALTTLSVGKSGKPASF